MPETTGVQLTGGVSQTGLNIGGLLSGLFGGGSEAVQQALQGAPVTALALNAERGPRPVRAPHQFLQMPPYVPDQTLPTALQPVIAQDSGTVSDAAPTPYQVWASGQVLGQGPDRSNAPLGGAAPSPSYQQPQGYPGIPDGGYPQPPGYGMQPPPGGWGPPPGMIPPRPSQVQSPYLDRARAINQYAGQLGTQMAGHAPPIPRPYPVGQNPNMSGFQNRIANARQVLNKNYANNNAANFKAQAEMYNKQVDNQWDRQKEGLHLMRDAARETYQQEGQIARDEFSEQQKAISAILETGKQQHYREAEEFMVTKISAHPTPERTRWILDTFNRTRGLIDLRDKIYMTYSAVDTMQESRDQSLKNKKQLFEQRSEKFKFDLEKAKQGALIAADRAEILEATKETVKEITRLRQEKLQLDNDLTAKYGDEDAQTKIALRRTTMQNAERAALDTARKGMQVIISDYLKMEQLGQNDSTGTMKQKIEEAYGPYRTISDEEAMAGARKEMPHASEQNIKIRAQELKKNFQGLPDNIARAYSWMQKEFRSEADKMLVQQRGISAGSADNGKRLAKPLQAGVMNMTYAPHVTGGGFTQHKDGSEQMYEYLHRPGKVKVINSKPPEKFNPQEHLGGRI